MRQFLASIALPTLLFGCSTVTGNISGTAKSMDTYYFHVFRLVTQNNDVKKWEHQESWWTWKADSLAAAKIALIKSTPYCTTDNTIVVSQPESMRHTVRSPTADDIVSGYYISHLNWPERGEPVDYVCGKHYLR